MLLRPKINANQIPVNQAPGITEHSGTVQSAIIRHTANQHMALGNQNNDRLSSYKSKKANLPDSSEENAILHNFIPKQSSIRCELLQMLRPLPHLHIMHFQSFQVVNVVSVVFPISIQMDIT